MPKGESPNEISVVLRFMPTDSSNELIIDDENASAYVKPIAIITYLITQPTGFAGFTKQVFSERPTLCHAVPKKSEE